MEIMKMKELFIIVVWGRNKWDDYGWLFIIFVCIRIMIKNVFLFICVKIKKFVWKK